MGFRGQSLKALFDFAFQGAKVVRNYIKSEPLELQIMLLAAGWVDNPLMELSTQGWDKGVDGFPSEMDEGYQDLDTRLLATMLDTACNHESSMVVWGSFRIPIDAYLFLHVYWVRSRVSFEDIFRCLWPSWKEIEKSELFGQLNF